MVVGNNWVILMIMSTLPWPILKKNNTLFDSESTTSTQTKHGATTARELHTPVKLITFHRVNMVTPLFKTSQNALSIAEQQQKHTRTTGTGQGSLPYSNLLCEIRLSAQMTKTLWPSKQEDNYWFLENIITVYLWTWAQTVGDET